MHVLQSLRAWWSSAGPVLTVLDPLAVLLATVPAVGDLGWGPVLLAAAAALVVARVGGLQSSRLVLSVLPDLPALVLAAVAAMATLVATSSVLGVQDDDWLLVGGYTLLILVIMVLLRIVTYAATRLLRRVPKYAADVVLVGSGEVGRHAAETLRARPDTGLVPVGFVDSGKQLSARGLPLPLLGGIDTLPRVLAEFGVRDVVFCFAEPPDRRSVEVVRAQLRRPGRVFLAGGTWPRSADRGRSEKVGDLTLTRLRRRRSRASSSSVVHRSTAAAGADEPEVHAGQLTR